MIVDVLSVVLSVMLYYIMCELYFAGFVLNYMLNTANSMNALVSVCCVTYTAQLTHRLLPAADVQ